jgi:hypothetical protein
MLADAGKVTCPTAEPGGKEERAQLFQELRVRWGLKSDKNRYVTWELLPRGVGGFSQITGRSQGIPDRRVDSSPVYLGTAEWREWR